MDLGHCPHILKGPRKSHGFGTMARLHCPTPRPQARRDRCRKNMYRTNGNLHQSGSRSTVGIAIKDGGYLHRAHISGLTYGAFTLTALKQTQKPTQILKNRTQWESVLTSFFVQDNTSTQVYKTHFPPSVSVSGSVNIPIKS